MRSALTLVLILVVCIAAFAQGQAPAVTNADATKRADSYVDKMSPEQKIDYIAGTGFAVRADRPFPLPFGPDELIREISAANRNTIVAITSGGNVDVAPWIEHVPGLIEMWYPGEQGGAALAEILFGVVNPSGHLPATFERSWQDNPTHGNYYPGAGTVRVPYKEGIFVGYRGYAAGKHWQADAGTFAILVGDSSAETPLSATVTLPKRSASARRNSAEQSRLPRRTAEA